LKIIGMIPARLGSTRVKNKNLRMIDGKPLIQYVVDTALQSKLLDEIYINSEATIFKSIADKAGICFYHRDSELSTNNATNDDFSLDFINNVECDILVQLLPTSPFVTVEEVDGFIEEMLDNRYETMVSVSEVKIECIYKKKSINFKQKEQTLPSQLLEPIKSYACALMGWDTNKFRSNMKKYSAAYHGGDGAIGFYKLKGYSTIDIDNEEDFILAEAVTESFKKCKVEPQYYIEVDEKNTNADVPVILVKDGVEINDLFDVNNEVVALSEVLTYMPKDKSWSKRVIDSESNSMTIICQMPGEGNRRHHHPDWNEWWYIIEGEWNWEIEGEIIKVKKGDIVFIEKNQKHKITAIGNDRAIRMAVSRSDVDHVYENEDY